MMEGEGGGALTRPAELGVSASVQVTYKVFQSNDTVKTEMYFFTINSFPFEIIKGRSDLADLIPCSKKGNLYSTITM